MSDRSPSEVRSEETTEEPTAADFYSDMNKHGSARYAAVRGDMIVEFDLSREAITVWQAARTHESGIRYYVPSLTDGNRYAWDAIARYNPDEREAAKNAWYRLTGEPRVLAFVNSHTYDGPRESRQAAADERRSDE